MNLFPLGIFLIIIQPCRGRKTGDGGKVRSTETKYTLTANNERGRIQSPNYPNLYLSSYKVEWTFKANETLNNPVVKLKFLDLHFPTTFTCYEDHVDVMDGPSMYHSTIKTFCGDSVPDIVTLSGDSATVYFYTNSVDNNYRGFQMDYWADEVTVKGALTTIKVTANTQHAFITSPNYPQPYAGSYSVEWNILANDSISNAIIHLKVLDSVLAMTFTCYEDIVEVMDGPSSMYSVIKDWCGESYPSAVIKASGDSATVSFSTNKGDNNYKGFNIEYWAEVDGSKGFGPVKMTSAHWALAVLSAIIYGTLFGGCIFLIAVKTNACQYDKSIHESRVIYEEHLIEDLPKHKVEDDKTVKKEIKRQKKKKQSNSKLPPISKTLRPTLNLKQWKNMLASK